MKINKKNDLSQYNDFVRNDKICNNCKFQSNEHKHVFLNTLCKKNLCKL